MSRLQYTVDNSGQVAGPWTMRGSKRLHQLSKSWADPREFWGLPGVQALGEFTKYDADLWRKASADKVLGKSTSDCFEQ